MKNLAILKELGAAPFLVTPAVVPTLSCCLSYAKKAAAVKLFTPLLLMFIRRQETCFTAAASYVYPVTVNLFHRRCFLRLSGDSKSVSPSLPAHHSNALESSHLQYRYSIHLATGLGQNLQNMSKSSFPLS